MHKRRARRQVVALWRQNWVAFLLAWGLAGSITVAAKSAACAEIELGWFGTVLSYVIFRTSTLTIIACLGVFYLATGVILYAARYKARLRDVQKCFFQPILAPALFVIAGYFLGVSSSATDTTQAWLAAPFSLAALLLATVVTSLYEIMEM